MENNHQEFIELAILESSFNVENLHGGPFGAVVVKDGKVISQGHNEVVLNNDPTAHAEVVAIRNACKNLNSFDLSGCTLYTSCEPCPMCLGAILWARISTVYFANTRKDAAEIGFDDELFYSEFALPIEKRSLPMIQIGREAGLKVFKNWQDRSAGIHY